MGAERSYFVYMLASKIGGATYIGVTNNLFRRIPEHRAGKGDAHTARHKVFRLVYYEATDSIDSAIAREKQLKNWERAWKIALIEETNPNWVDLFPALKP